MPLGHSPDGRLRRSVYGETRKEVVAKLAAIARERDSGAEAWDGRITVGEYLKQWLESKQASIRPSTYGSYEGVVRLHLRPAIGRLPLARLTPPDIQSVLNTMQRSGLAPNTVKYTLSVLRLALNRAVRYGLVARNVATLVDPPRIPYRPMKVLNPEQAQRLLEVSRSDRLHALYVVALTLGLRRGEALGLRWEDVDPNARRLHVRRALQRISRQGMKVVETKTPRSRRTLVLPDVTVEALREHRLRQLQERLGAGSRWVESGFVFTTTIGTPLDGDNLHRSFKRALYEAGVPSVRFHDLRHSAASVLLAQGVPARVVMETLGHSQISLTMNTYSHVMPSLLTEAAEAMDRALGRGVRRRPF